MGLAIAVRMGTITVTSGEAALQLTAVLDMIDAFRTARAGSPERVPPCTELDQLYDRLFELAAAAAARPAANSAELAVKALAIRALTEEQSGDIVHMLAESLARDLLEGGRVTASS
jgi:hypothetical protein